MKSLIHEKEILDLHIKDVGEVDKVDKKAPSQRSITDPEIIPTITKRKFLLKQR